MHYSELLLAFMKVTERERDGGNLMYSRALAQESLADLQRCLAHPEIHYRCVSGTHLDTALRQQITTNDLHLSLSADAFFFSKHTSPFPFSLFRCHLSPSACFPSASALRIPHLSSHSSLLSVSSTVDFAKCQNAQLKCLDCSFRKGFTSFDSLHILQRYIDSNGFILLPV